VAHTKSALKRLRQSARLHEANKSRISEARGAVRKARELVAEGKGEEAAAAVREASSVLDRAAQKGVIHKNNASRRKARLARMLTRGVPQKATPRRRRTAKSS
jgi:small subunit ribosomal protein S20